MNKIVRQKFESKSTFDSPFMADIIPADSGDGLRYFREKETAPKSS